jgi:hypothetical protein
MGLIAKRRPAELYGKLLILYPARYRRQYEKPMVQTFDDMLKGEQSQLGRFGIWLRVLWDLPVSAAKEHITNGKDLPMNRNIKILFGGIVLLLLLANGASFWFGSLHSRQTSGIEKVSTAQIADAMQGDHFYSSYGNAGLLFTGRVTGIRQKGNTALVSFETDRPYSVTCQFVHAGQVKKGDSLSIAAPGGSAERLPHGVLLHNCLTN